MGRSAMASNLAVVLGCGIQERVVVQSWVKPATVTLTVPLHAGDNTVRVYNDTAYAPDLDRIVVRPANN